VPAGLDWSLSELVFGFRSYSLLSALAAGLSEYFLKLTRLFTDLTSDLFCILTLHIIFVKVKY